MVWGHVESAEILLSHGSVDMEVSCDWLTSSALLLAISFKYTNYTNEAEDVIWMAINRLEQQLTHRSSDPRWVSHHLARLYGQLKICITLNEHGAKNHHDQANLSTATARIH